MTLRQKTLILIGIIVVALTIGLYFVSRTIMLRSFARLEEEYAQEHIERIRNILLDNFAALDTFLFDWAAWDDTYEFIEDVNQEYIRSNLVDETFLSSRLHVILFVNTAGELVYAKALDLQLAQEMPTPEDLRQHLSPDSPLLFHPDEFSNLTGVLLLAENPMIVSARPILQSSKEGPIRGTLIMGRYLDAEELYRLSEITRQSLSIYRFDEDADASLDVRQARSSFAQGGQSIVQVLSASSIAGYTVINDVYGDPGFILKVTQQRDIYEQGQTSVLYLVSSVLIISVILGGSILLLLERLVLFRLEHLSLDVQQVRSQNDLSTRVSVIGEDELARLASSINSMLSAQEQFQESLQESEALYRGLVETSPDAIMVSDLSGKLTMVNQRAAQLYGYSDAEEMLREDTQQMMIQDNTELAIEEALQIIKAGNVRRIECTIRKKDNTPFTAEISTSVLVNADNHPVAFIDSVRDISTRKQEKDELRKYHEQFEHLLKERTDTLKTTNQQLKAEIAAYQRQEMQSRRSHAQIQHILDAFPDTYFQVKPDGTIVDLHLGTEAESYMPADCAGQQILGILPPNIARLFARAIPQVLKKKLMIRIEYAVPGTREHKQYDEARFVPFIDDRLLILIRDVTEYRGMEKTFQDIEAQIAQLSPKPNSSQG
ncbi:MAG: PAS domain S-box protein [bacterium]|nr:PAS domain S-box protein [bacterium]